MDSNPYAPPHPPSFQPPSQNPAQGPRGYQSPNSSGKLALAAIGAVTGLSILFRVLDLTVVAIPAMASPFSIAIEKILNPLFGFVRLGAAIGFLRWVHRAATNVRALGRPLRWSPRMCVLWFFIPIASLVMPCFVVMQIAAASQERGKPLFTIPLWWVAYLLAVLVGVVRRAVGVVFTRKLWVIAVGVDCVGTVFTTVAFVALYFVIRAMDRAQERLAETARDRDVASAR